MEKGDQGAQESEETLKISENEFDAMFDSGFTYNERMPLASAAVL